jgi:hypothetical protein
MKIDEAVVTGVLAETAKRLSDPNYLTDCVALFMAEQPDLTRYVVAHNAKLGAEGTAQLLFQGSIVQKMISRCSTSPLIRVTFAELDKAIRACADLEALALNQPDLASYIFSNLDAINGPAELTGKLLAHLAQSFINRGPR